MSSFYHQPGIQKIIKKVSALHTNLKTAVLATGVFDLLHVEHQNYLKASKKEGDYLVVAIESDKRTRELKGEGRPVHPQAERLHNVQSVSEVDDAFILPEDFNSQEAYEELLRQLKPDVYAVSSHSSYLENKRKLIEKYGGKLVIVHQHNPNVSTTRILLHQK